jgi:hypothetical protein
MANPRPSFRGFLFAVERDFAVHHDCEVAAAIEELHDALSRARELGPARFCLGVLLDAAQRVAFEFEINLPQAVCGSADGGIRHAINFGGGGTLDQDLPPDRDEGLCEGHAEAIVNQVGETGQRARVATLAEPLRNFTRTRANRKQPGS